MSRGARLDCRSMARRKGIASEDGRLHKMPRSGGDGGGDCKSGKCPKKRRVDSLGKQQKNPPVPKVEAITDSSQGTQRRPCENGKRQAWLEVQCTDENAKEEQGDQGISQRIEQNTIGSGVKRGQSCQECKTQGGANGNGSNPSTTADDEPRRWLFLNDGDESAGTKAICAKDAEKINWKMSVKERGRCGSKQRAQNHDGKCHTFQGPRIAHQHH